MLLGKVTNYDVTAADDGLFFNAVVWVLRTGAPYADLPERFGKCNSVCRRFRRLVKKGAWATVFEALKVPDLDWVMLDSIVVRVNSTPPAKKATPRPSV